MAKRKKLIVVDSSGLEVKCYTLAKAASLLGISKSDLRLIMYKSGKLPYYKLMGRAKRKVIRIKADDLDQFRKTREFFDNIADKIIQARNEMPVTRIGMMQKELAKDVGLTTVGMNIIERKKERVGFKTLEKIAKALDKEFDWFLA